MRPPLAKAVLKSFSSRISEELSQFSTQEPVGALVGGLLYRWSLPSNLVCYIYIQLSAKDDSFMVELSCSKGEFPINLVAFGPHDVREGCIRFRLPELYRQEWAHNSRRVPWWWIGAPTKAGQVTETAVERAMAGTRPLTEEGMPVEQALQLVEPKVEDAIDRIKRFGIPFVEDFAKSQRTKL